MEALSAKAGNILVVDSNRQSADELAVLIRRISPNYEVQRVHSGTEAVRMSQKGSANVIVVAEKLSDMTALTFSEIVKCVQKRTTCILLSEQHGLLEKRWRKAFECSRVLKKPYDPSQLAHTLDCALDHSGLSGKIRFNRRLARLFAALIPVALVLGVVAGVISKT
jgi:DNA-binding NtrC family response regulator